ncbi:MAG: hypothetical protein CBB97_22620 [Candidatus Endolissoclinum sp. TMED37]|nr:MAG: hypothetical protein CBB97_22620 [Candidatus Endolissoclinum sp. TMED37]
MYSDLEITTFHPHIKFQNIKEIILSNLDSIKKYIPLEITNHHQLNQSADNCPPWVIQEKTPLMIYNIYLSMLGLEIKHTVNIIITIKKYDQPNAITTLSFYRGFSYDIIGFSKVSLLLANELLILLKHPIKKKIKKMQTDVDQHLSQLNITQYYNINDLIPQLNYTIQEIYKQDCHFETIEESIKLLEDLFHLLNLNKHKSTLLNKNNYNIQILESNQLIECISCISHLLSIDNKKYVHVHNDNSIYYPLHWQLLIIIMSLLFEMTHIKLYNNKLIVNSLNQAKDLITNNQMLLYNLNTFVVTKINLKKINNIPTHHADIKNSIVKQAANRAANIIIAKII